MASEGKSNAMRGGERPGAGRPKRSAQPRRDRMMTALASGRLSPLDYMLVVMNDPAADPTRRDRMAVAAAPHLHVRAAGAKLGKKGPSQSWGSGGLHDVRARPLAFGPDFHQPQNPSHASTLGQRTSAEIPDRRRTPNLATVPPSGKSGPKNTLLPDFAGADRAR